MFIFEGWQSPNGKRWKKVKKSNIKIMKNTGSIPLNFYGSEVILDKQAD
jgi:hypothetical protein